MRKSINKPDERVEFFNSRLDEVRMSPYERIRAKASLARAEAMADALVGIAKGVRRLLKAAVVRPFRRLTESLG